jgi:hypothetical protein
VKVLSKRKAASVVVGFFTDVDGKVKPVTRGMGSLYRKKVILSPKQFRGVKPRVSRKRLIAQLFDGFWNAYSSLEFRQTKKEATEMIAEAYADWVEKSREGKRFDRLKEDYVKKVEAAFGKTVARAVDSRIEQEGAESFVHEVVHGTRVRFKMGQT